MQNQTVTGYTLHHLIGEGGMAEVWYAENRIGKKAAIKIIKKELSLLSEIVSRFENEARVMVTLNQPNIRQVYDYSIIDNRPCIIMEYLEGNDLSARLKNGERFSNEQIIDWWNQIVEALNYTHKKEVVHRDIKPSNIFLTDDGKIKLLDYGIAKIKGGLSNTQTGTRMGTLMYMSPEQVKDSKYVDYRTDVYSLAVSFYHLLSGEAPYDNTNSSDWEIQTKIVMEPLDLYKLSEDWKTFLKAYLNKDPQQRPLLKLLTENGQTQNRASNGFVFEHQYVSRSTMADEETVISQRNEKFLLNGRPAIEWVDVPAGNFTMGSPRNEKNRESDEIWHNVTINAFKMSKYEVTFEQYDLFCEATGREKPSDEGWGREKRPVINVSWHDSKAFAEWIGCRLPTEAEWEYACRAGTTTPFNTGNCISTVEANYDGNYPYKGCIKGEYRKKTLPVGNFPSNAWGLFDMLGNVLEWCYDWYGEYPIKGQANPKGPTSGTHRVSRGGCWYSTARNCRSAFRNFNLPENYNDHIGFRLVYSNNS